MNKVISSSLGWFVIINSFFAMLISSRYFQFFPAEAFTPLSTIFVVTSIVGQMALLSAVIGLFGLIIRLLIKPAKIAQPIVALIAALSVTLLVLDTFVFAQYRFHINAVVVGLVFAGDVVTFPLITWVLAIGGFVVIFLAEWWVLAKLESKAQQRSKKVGRKLGWGLFVIFLIANGIHTWSVAQAIQPVTMVTRYIPLYYPLTANSLMKKFGMLDVEALENQKKLKVGNKGDLSYPLNPIQSVASKHQKDIMFIVVDSWRYDSFNSTVSPFMWKLAQQGTIYHNHLSTGNATRTGIFGLFYGIPGTYWQAFLANQRPSAFVQQLQHQNYQLGIFTSAQLTKPEFSQTVFRSVPHLRIRTEGTSPSSKDRRLTDDWKQWYSQQDSHNPRFSFLFYDAPHGFDFPENYPHKFEPMVDEINYLGLNNDTDPTPIMNRYKTSVRFVDDLVKEVVETLKASGRLDNTLIVLTGDHAQELNDNKLNFWGHNGNFTDAQIHVPFVILGADSQEQITPEYIEGFSSHEDVVPTIMKHYLGVTNPLKDYTTGVDLFGEYHPRDWLISSKFSGYAIVTKDSILEVGQTGGFEMMDKRNRPLNKPLNGQQLNGALEKTSRYLK